MVVSNPNARQSVLLWASTKCVLAASGVGLLLWLSLLAFLNGNGNERFRLLLLVIALQVSFLVTAFQFQRPTGGAILLGVLLMLTAVVLGVLYDGALRTLFGSAAPTLGPWGEARRLSLLPACAIVTWGVLIGPAGDECFFRAGLFGNWQAAERPWSGAVLSSGLFALARLDLWNLPAYFGLGMLLCAVYHWTGSLATVWIGHGLLNAVLLVFLFCGYE